MLPDNVMDNPYYRTGTETAISAFVGTINVVLLSSANPLIGSVLAVAKYALDQLITKNYLAKLTWKNKPKILQDPCMTNALRGIIFIGSLLILKRYPISLFANLSYESILAFGFISSDSIQYLREKISPTVDNPTSQKIKNLCKELIIYAGCGAVFFYLANLPTLSGALLGVYILALTPMLEFLYSTLKISCSSLSSDRIKKAIANIINLILHLKLAQFMNPILGYHQWAAAFGIYMFVQTFAIHINTLKKELLSSDKSLT